jgi:hypothetical protein
MPVASARKENDDPGPGWATCGLIFRFFDVFDAKRTGSIRYDPGAGRLRM